MIALVSGTLVQTGLTEIIVETGGIGYRIFIPMSTYDKLPREGEQTKLLTYMHVREDAMHLYGFANGKEKKLFEMLISVSGIGAKSALNILSSMPVQSFCSAIINEDIKALSRINGIGKKSAERMIVELREKAKKLAPELAYEEAEAAGDSGKALLAAEEAVLALEQLGFKIDKVRKVIHNLVNELPENECSSENLIKTALKNLNT